MKSYVFGVLLTCYWIVAGNVVLGHKALNHDPDRDRNVTQLIESKGYPVENHIVQTKDGFLLSMQHILHGRTNCHTNGPKPAVILQHGLLSSAADYVMNFPEQSLGFILADAGFDVWLGNSRGTTYSRHHIKYTPEMNEFWDFSFNELGEYDLPAMIDYVLSKTNQNQLFYIGHSQGTTSAFVLLSEKPEYNEKIKLFIALAPVAFAGEATCAITYLAPFISEIDFLETLIGAHEFLPNDMITKYLSFILCASEKQHFCDDILFFFWGEDPLQLNSTRVPVYLAHTPAGSSTKSVVHYLQLANSKLFTKYDYGKEGNKKRYNQATPPEYDLSKITAPVALMWSLNDRLADPADVGLLREKLKTVVSSYCVPFPLFNHGDFVLGIDANRLVYDHVISLMRSVQ